MRAIRIKRKKIKSCSIKKRKTPLPFVPLNALRKNLFTKQIVNPHVLFYVKKFKFISSIVSEKQFQLVPNYFAHSVYVCVYVCTCARV